jgi:hypothetical protein
MKGAVAGRVVLALALGATPTTRAAETPEIPETPDVPVFAQRLDTVSRELLGQPYVLGPLGEEAPPDLDPRFRLDAFDCTTYVETVIALALEDGADDATKLRRLDHIRYSGGVPTFATRRHLIDAQWIPELERDGVLDDVTRRIGGRATRTASLRLGRAAWDRSVLATDLGLDWDAVPHGRQTLAYLPWPELEREEVRAALPRIAILNVIANPTPRAPTLVIHQALLFHSESGWVARHASSSARRVVEEPLDVFLTRARARRSGAALGINVLAIVGVD